MEPINPSQMPPVMQQPEQHSKGALIAVIIILAVIIVGGLYFLKQRNKMDYKPAVEQKDQITESLRQQGGSDEVNSIEADLQSTNFDNLDQGASVLEYQLQ